MKGQSNTFTMMIGLMIALVIGVSAVLTTVADISKKATELNTLTNESVTATAVDTSVNLAQGGALKSGQKVKEITQVANRSAILITANYTFNDTALKFSLLAGNTGIYNVTYKYSLQEYIESATSRTLTALLPTLVAVILIVATVGVIGIRGLGK